MAGQGPPYCTTTVGWALAHQRETHALWRDAMS